MAGNSKEILKEGYSSILRGCYYFQLHFESKYSVKPRDRNLHQSKLPKDTQNSTNIYGFKYSKCCVETATDSQWGSISATLISTTR